MVVLYGKRNDFLKDNGFIPMKTKNKEGKLVVTSYFINSNGDIVRRDANSQNGYKFLDYIPDKNGYDRQGYNVCGVNMMKRRNILVAENFIPNPNNYPQVNHINRNVRDNRVCNLEWVTNKMNSEHEKRTRHLRISVPDYPIIQLKQVNENELVFIKRFNSKKDIPTYMDNNPHKIQKCNIIAVCNNTDEFKHRKTYRGYVWMYEQDYLKKF